MFTVMILSLSLSLSLTLSLSRSLSGVKKNIFLLICFPLDGCPSGVHVGFGLTCFMLHEAYCAYLLTELLKLAVSNRINKYLRRAGYT